MKYFLLPIIVSQFHIYIFNIFDSKKKVATTIWKSQQRKKAFVGNSLKNFFFKNLMLLLVRIFYVFWKSKGNSFPSIPSTGNPLDANEYFRQRNDSSWFDHPCQFLTDILVVTLAWILFLLIRSYLGSCKITTRH